MFLRKRRPERNTDLNHILVRAQTISFYYPGYAHFSHLFLTFLAPDDPCGELHHLIALMACGIVYFSIDPNGLAVEDLPNSVLKGNDY